MRRLSHLSYPSPTYVTSKARCEDSRQAAANCWGRVRGEREKQPSVQMPRLVMRVDEQKQPSTMVLSRSKVAKSGILVRTTVATARSVGQERPNALGKKQKQASTARAKIVIS